MVLKLSYTIEIDKDSIPIDVTEGNKPAFVDESEEKSVYISEGETEEETQHNIDAEKEQQYCEFFMGVYLRKVYGAKFSKIIINEVQCFSNGQTKARNLFRFVRDPEDKSPISEMADSLWLLVHILPKVHPPCMLTCLKGDVGLMTRYLNDLKMTAITAPIISATEQGDRN